MKKRRWALLLGGLAMLAYTRLGSALPSQTAQSVDGTQLDVQSLTTGVGSGPRATIKSVHAVATLSTETTVPPAQDFVPVTFQPQNSIAPVELTTVSTESQATTPPGTDPQTVPGGETTDTTQGSSSVPMPGAAALPGATDRVAPLVYEVAERRPDFVYRPGRLDFQAQSTYDASQSGLAVGPGVRPGTTRFVPVGSF